MSDSHSEDLTGEARAEAHYEEWLRENPDYHTLSNDPAVDYTVVRYVLKQYKESQEPQRMEQFHRQYGRYPQSKYEFQNWSRATFGVSGG